VWAADEEVDEHYNSLFRELLTYMMSDPRTIASCAHLLFIGKNLPESEMPRDPRLRLPFLLCELLLDPAAAMDWSRVAPVARSSCRRRFCWMRLAIAQPCLGSREIVLRISKSRVPWTKSVGFAICLGYQHL